LYRAKENERAGHIPFFSSINSTSVKENMGWWKKMESL
jgi:hypothetical protein